MYLFGLGVRDNKKKLEKSPLLKFRSHSSYDKVTKKWFYIGLVLRENGRVEIYSDFILVNHIYDPTFQCVDIEIGNSYFFLKHVVDSHLVTGADDSTKLEYKFRKVKMKLKNRIGPSTLNPENTLDFME